MPTEREKIEAELRMNERDRVIDKLKRLLVDIEESEQALEAREAELGLPTDRSRPLTERLARLGASKEAITEINLMFDLLGRLVRGNDLPQAAKQLLAEIADAEYSAIDQLAALRESRR